MAIVARRNTPPFLVLTQSIQTFPSTEAMIGVALLNKISCRHLIEWETFALHVGTIVAPQSVWPLIGSRTQPVESIDNRLLRPRHSARPVSILYAQEENAVRFPCKRPVYCGLHHRHLCAEIRSGLEQYEPPRPPGVTCVGETRSRIRPNSCNRQSHSWNHPVPEE